MYPFFFLTTLARRKHNRIECLKDDSRTWMASRDLIGKAFIDKFRDTFNEDLAPSDIDLSLLISPSILEAENDSLLAIPEWDEIRNTIFHMGYFKALLANRVKPILAKLICLTRSAFVPGKSIHDNSIMIQEVIHAMKEKQGSQGWMALKIDLQKASQKEVLDRETRCLLTSLS
ncbi:hypothetical protein UlMin_042393 [Ulmus minor]